MEHLPDTMTDEFPPPYAPAEIYTLRVTRPIAVPAGEGFEELLPGTDFERPGSFWNAIVALEGDGAVHSPPEEPEPPPLTVMPLDSRKVDRERDRRIAAGFGFAGKVYQSRQTDRENISGAATAALAAIAGAAAPGDLRWHGGTSDFAWIAADNTLVPMDAQTMHAFGMAAMAHKQAHIFAARALKDEDPIPADYQDDAYWPAVPA